MACLVEKQRTTPDQYPLTLNSLRLACNQSTNRDPVVDYDEATIRSALDRLTRRKWTTLASWSTARSVKYKHVLDQALGLSDPELALMTVLMLRGPQTPGELRARSERIHRFESGDELDSTLAGAGRARPGARLPRRPGERGQRYEQLLSAGEDEAAAPPAPVEPAAPSGRAGGPRAAGPGRPPPRASSRAWSAWSARSPPWASSCGPCATSSAPSHGLGNPAISACARSRARTGQPEMGHMHPPVTQREAQLAPVIPPVEPSAQFAARVGSGIFAGEALHSLRSRAASRGLRARRGTLGHPRRLRAVRPRAAHGRRQGRLARRSRRPRPAARCWCPPTCCCPPRARRWPARRSTAGWPSTPPTSSPPARRPPSSR